MTKARIYRPAKTAMQSGKVGTRRWVLEYEPAEKKLNDPIMGWAGSGDMRSQIRLKFDSFEEAEDYARRKGLEFVVRKPRVAKPKYQTYAGNFK